MPETFYQKLMRLYGPLRHTVVALPQLTDFIHEINEPDKNRTMYADVFKGKGYTLREVGTATLKLYDTAVALLDDRAVLPIKHLYLFEHGTYGGKKVCFERFLWKDEGEWSALRIDDLRVAQWVFFHLIEHFNAVISDQKHTEAGARWWVDTAKKALAKGYDVLAISPTGTRKLSVELLPKFVPILWGKEDKYQERHIAISKSGYLTSSPP